MVVPFHDGGIISQFEGYEKLRDLDWKDYRALYGNIQRLDLILEAENNSTNRYKLSKQADELRLNQELPREIERLDMSIRYREHSLDQRLTSDSLTIRGMALRRRFHCALMMRSSNSPAGRPVCFD